MLEPGNDMLPPVTSPTTSSISSSDLDTESTGSFFHDRSTTLGTLMGVNFPAITFRGPSQHREASPAAASTAAVASSMAIFSSRKIKTSKKKKNKNGAAAVVMVAERRRKWWSICQDDGGRPASLGEFLEIERRFGDSAFYDGATGEEIASAVRDEPSNGRVLFADGRVLPPSTADLDEGTSSTAGALCRFPVSLTGICSGGAG